MQASVIRSHTELTECLTDLNFISSISPGDKINVGSRLIRSQGWGTSIIRTLNFSENKEVTLKFFQSILHKAIHLISYYSTMKDDEFYKEASALLKKGIEASKKGVISTMKTYSYDSSYVSQLKALITVMDLKMMSFNIDKPIVLKHRLVDIPRSNPIDIKYQSNNKFASI